MFILVIWRSFFFFTFFFFFLPFRYGRRMRDTVYSAARPSKIHSPVGVETK